MSGARVIAAVLLPATMVVTSLQFATTAPAATRTCDAVVFSKNSEDGTSPIKAKNVSCKTARAVARKSKGHGPFGSEGEPLSYRSHGFNCTGYETDDTLPTMHWKCTKGNARITFTKT